MKVEFTPEQEALRTELRAYFDELMTPELRAEVDATPGEGGGELFWQAMDKLGKDGWIGVGWSKERGGRGMTAFEQMIFIEEVMRAGFPFPFLTTESVGPILADNASERMRDLLVPKILEGKLIMAIAYSEPGSGTDLASLTTTAIRDGDEWVIKGQKIFTSLAQHADYVWIAARTNQDPAVKKHKGISIFLVPTTAEGYDRTPIHTLGDVTTNATYYDNVRIPADHLVGELDAGWKLITSQLNRERLSLVNCGPVSQLLNETMQWADKNHYTNGKRVLDEPWVQMNLAKVRVGIEALKLMCYKQAWSITNDKLEMADASAAKVYGTEFFIEAYRLLAEVLGQVANEHLDSKGVQLRGRLEMMYRTASIITFGGGANEIQRDIISAAGLWMPRASR
ncbi:acyl-CoA dehydrogenase [Sinobacterium caligoides]|uniref:Acyl-CoA dehydrogenase n=1 Tax=Sinobacterium caligoides TaxID=933926 RepID=A0A3N2DZK4_9GAMM|nr:acyl-CoA dehydrogenase family protein [Sinobacterium caligoides]ROS05296.1 acyl-CoA dehydrogenase [Sinobacterium caligoides]